MTTWTLPHRLALSALLLLGSASIWTTTLAAGADVPTTGSVCAARIAVANEAARPVQEIFVRASGTTAWGRDLLGEAVLRPGQTIEIAPALTGAVDLMVMAPDGTARALWRLDACAVRRVALSASFALLAE